MQNAKSAIPARTRRETATPNDNDNDTLGKVSPTTVSDLALQT